MTLYALTGGNPAWAPRLRFRRHPVLHPVRTAIVLIYGDEAREYRIVQRDFCADGTYA